MLQETFGYLLMTRHATLLIAVILFCFANAVKSQYILPGKTESQRKEIPVKGYVVDEKLQPIEFATVKIDETGTTTQTDNKGVFILSVPGRFDSLTVIVSSTGKQTINIMLHKKDFPVRQRIVLQDQSLTLKDVQVEAMRERLHSNSSIVFDKEAIAQSQAFSLADLLNKLPGKLTQAPNLQSPQTLTLRTNSDGLNAMSNSFGIAIYIDGVRMNNDANMQARSLSIRGITGAGITSYRDSSFDVPYNGFDLRDIPIENIERIEVIQGVADARYGEMTNGAILITTRAGKTPTNITVNVNGGSTQATASRGFQLRGKGGAINLSGGYTNSNKDPRDKVKSYSRANASAKWTVNILPAMKNTFSFGYDTRLDNVKMDPDDDSRRRTYAKSHTINIAEHLNYDARRGFLRNASIDFGYSRGKQDTYNQWLLNGPPIGIADKDTTGVYEGYYIPGNYLAVERIVGIPISINGSINLTSKTFFTGNISHRLSAGSQFSSSGNKGPGTIVDPDKPRWIGSSLTYRSERPVDLDKTLPFLSNWGMYVQDNASGKLFNRKYTATLGFRTDIQNGFVGYAPRIGVTYALSHAWGLNLAYGISTKALSLADRYPTPAWIDIPILDLYNGYAAQSLFLVYTKKIIPDNSFLKASRNRSIEAGVTFNNKWSNASLYLYANKNINGYNSTSTPILVNVPDYSYTIDSAHKISYYPTGTQTQYITTRQKLTNGLYTGDYGAELMYSTKEIPALATGFSLRSAFTYSTYDNHGDRTLIAVNPDYQKVGKPALFGVYKPAKNHSYSLISTVATNTHIPNLGFTVTISTDVVMLQHRVNDPRSYSPIGYLDNQLNYVAINSEDVHNTEYDYLRTQPDKSVTSETHFIYPSVNITIAKEIRKKIRLMITGYNMFNIRPKYIDPVTKEVTVYNQPTSLSAGITFQL